MNQAIKISILLMLLIFSGLGYAQKGKVRGQIIDGETGDPLFSANAVLKGTTIGSTTDFDGKYELSADAGTYDLELSFIGMENVVITGVKLKGGDVTVVEAVTLKPATNQLGEVTISVEATRNTAAAMVTLKKKSANVIDGISAGELKKTGDSDAGDAAKRVTGVSVEGGKYVFVRGLGDRYTKTMLNGVDIPGLDPDRNAIQIDIFPTNLIDNMTILKSALAELPADFSGGVVNIETKDFPIKQILNVSLGLGYNPSMHFNSNYLTYDGGSTDFLGFDDGTRSLPDGAQNERIPSPVYGSAYTDGQINSFIKSFNPTLGAMKQTSFMDYDLGLTTGDQYSLKSGNKVGYIFSLTYKNTTRYYDDAVYGEYLRPTDADDYELDYATIREGELGDNNILLGGLAGLAYKTPHSKYQLNIMHLQNGENQAGQFKESNSEAVGQSGYEAYSNILSYTQRGLTNIFLSGEHHIEDDKWVVDWKLSPTFSKIDEPDIRKTSFTITLQGDSVFNAGAGGNPIRIWRYLNEVNAVGQVNIKRRFTLFERGANLKFGVSHTYKQRDYNILSYELQSFGNQPNFNGDPNQILTDDLIYPNGPLYYNSGNGNPNPNQYSSTANNTGLYVQAEASPTTLLKVILGLRAENFVQTHTGRDQLGASGDPSGNVLNDTEVLNALDLFPSANLIFALNENQNLRFSYFRSIARPSFKELSFAQILDPISNRTFNGGLLVYPDWSGDLTETRINNFDLRWETFMKPGELISFSAFAKYFNDAIELVRIRSANTNPDFQPRNVGDGQVYGAEVEVRKNLAFINPALERLGVSGNFTYVYSRIEMTPMEYDARKDYEKDGQTVEKTRAMAGQAPYIINGGITYDDLDKDFNAGLFYNVKGRTLEVVGGALFPDVYTEMFHSLNFTASKSFGKDGRSNLSLKISNILNDVRESFFVGYKAEDQIFTSLNPGTEISIGYSYRFK